MEKSTFFKFAIWPQTKIDLLSESLSKAKKVRPFLYETHTYPTDGATPDYEKRTLREADTRAPHVMALFRQTDAKGRPNMSAGRIQHSANVAHAAACIARDNPDFGIHPYVAWHGALWHDVAKDMDNQGVPHAIRGGRIAKYWVGKEWARAISQHSTGGYRMSPESKILMLADSISADRSTSSGMKKLRDTARKDANKALGLIFQGHFNTLVNGGATRRPFVPDREALGGYGYHTAAGRLTRHRAGSAWELLGEHNPNLHLHINLQDKAVRKIVGSMMFQLESANRRDRAQIMHDWMTIKNDRRAQLFRAWLPALIPIFRARYESVVKDAHKIGGRAFATRINEAENYADLMNAHSDKNIEHLRRFFTDSMWHPVSERGRRVFWDPRHNDFKKIKLNKSYDFFRSMSHQPLTDITGLHDTDVIERIFPDTEEEYDNE